MGVGDPRGALNSSPALDVSRYTDATHSTDLTRMQACASSSGHESLPSREPVIIKSIKRLCYNSENHNTVMIRVIICQ